MRMTGKEFDELVGFNEKEFDPPEQHVDGTTVIALRFDKGCLVMADRRATMGNLIMYEDANKIESLDEETVVAISGAYARAIDVIRYLKHAFKYYERLNLFKISMEGKLMEISRALAGNMAGQGGGFFLPIVAAYDRANDEFGVYFFDGAGAKFLGSDYAAAGSGSERIRGVFEYIAVEKGAFSTRSQEDVLKDGLKLLDLASQMDSATGGIVRKPPKVSVLTKEGVVHLEDDDLQQLVDETLGLHPGANKEKKAPVKRRAKGKK